MKRKQPARTKDGVLARIVIDGKTQSFVLLTSNFDWAASSVAGIDQTRWAIEV